jgi:hypothetical protein
MRDESGRPGQAADQAGASLRERWARLRRSLWQPPRPHGEQPRERVVLGLALVVLLSIPWGLAVARRLASPADSP